MRFAFEVVDLLQSVVTLLADFAMDVLILPPEPLMGVPALAAPTASPPGNLFMLFDPSFSHQNFWKPFLGNLQ